MGTVDRDLVPVSVHHDIDLAVRYPDVPVLITAHDVRVRRGLAQHIHDHSCETATFVMLHSVDEWAINPFQLGRATVYIDDVGGCDARQQAALMRLLDHRGAVAATSWRIIATADAHLYGSVVAGAFPPDLYYRLSVLHIVIPG
jgi:hypothetical protein